MKLLIVLFLLLTSLSLSAQQITNYHTNNFCFQPKNSDELAVIRTFNMGKDRLQLMVNTRTLKTHIQPMVKTIGHTCGESNYQRLLTQSSHPPYPLQNDGITHGRGGITITTDLCPSSKSGFEEELYISMINRFINPAPVTIFITGLWIEKHTVEFKKLIQWERDANLSITWGNHTYSHPYNSKVELSKNFSLTTGYDLRKDTLRLEQLLISQGITPSIFFRFPGLVSDERTIKTIHNLGLVTIGSDAWLAKGEMPKGGSIVLLHGNRNEPQGIIKFRKLLDENQTTQIQSLTHTILYPPQ